MKKTRKRVLVFSSPPLFVLCVAVMGAVPGSAQDSVLKPQVLTHPVVNKPVHFDISPPVRELVREVPPRYGLYPAPPVRQPKLQHLMQAARQNRGPAVDEALQTYIGPNVSALIGLNLLGVGNGFPGVIVTGFPPDVNLAVGDSQVVQWTNIGYAVFDKTAGTVIAGPIASNQFWKGFGGPCETSNFAGDIIAQWDKIAHRWLMAYNVFSPPYMICISVSQTPDATGSYYRFAYAQNNGLPDYPKWGVWPDAYYQHNNSYGGPNGFSSQPCAYDRAAMVRGDSSALQICFVAPTTFDDTLLPADLDSADMLPPKGSPEVFLGSIDNGDPKNSNKIYEYLFHVDFVHPGNSTFSGSGGTKPITVKAFGLACGGFGSCIPQKGVSDRLDGLGAWLMYRLAYRNFGDHQTWLVSHSVDSPTGQVGMRWYEFRAAETSTKLTVYQQGTYAPDKNYRWMGSIAMDKKGDIALGYSISSSSLFPSINFTGRVPTDPKGTMESEAQIVAGTGSQLTSDNRWGDYTSMAIDEQDDCTFWYTAEYYITTKPANWSTQLASFNFPSCGS